MLGEFSRKPVHEGIWSEIEASGCPLLRSRSGLGRLEEALWAYQYHQKGLGAGVSTTGTP
jgi:hypothetical protein